MRLFDDERAVVSLVPWEAAREIFFKRFGKAIAVDVGASLKARGQVEWSKTVLGVF